MHIHVFELLVIPASSAENGAEKMYLTNMANKFKYNKYHFSGDKYKYECVHVLIIFKAIPGGTSL